MKPIGHPDTFSVDSIGHPDTPPIGHPDTQWSFKAASRLHFGNCNYARASLTSLKAFNVWAGGGANAEEQRLPFGILPSPRRLRRRPAAGVLPARSAAPAPLQASTTRFRWDGRGTPRKSLPKRVARPRAFHPWRNPLLGSAQQERGYAIMRNDPRTHARIRVHVRICANRRRCCTSVHIVAYSCVDLEGKMCIAPVRGRPRPFQYRPYSRFALDDILLCEADGRSCGRESRHA